MSPSGGISNSPTESSCEFGVDRRIINKEKIMTEKKKRSGQAADLRMHAENIVRMKTIRMPENQDAPSPAETRQMLHELRVHQTELEIQNEELRLTQEKLEAARARYFDLYDLAPVGYFTVSEKGLILEANLTAATLLGVRRVDLVEQPLRRFVAKEEQDSYYRRFGQLFETGEPQAWALEMLKKDDMSIWVRMETTAAQDADGTTVCRAVMIDITQEREQVEHALQELKVKVGEEALYHSLVDMASEGFWLLDKEFLTVYVNRALENLLGYAKEELIGRSWYDFGDPEWVDRAKELEKRRVSGVKEPHPFLFIRKNGSKVLTRIATTPLYDEEGNFNGALGILSDITEEKEAEEQVKSSLKEKEVLLKELQHRVKNNLLTISGILSLQLESIKDRKSKDIFITSINRIKAMTRIHTRLYQSGNYSRINFKGYIEELAWELSRSYGFPPGNMITNVEDISIDISTAIPTGLIVNELVSNAMKHAFPSLVTEDRGTGQPYRDRKGKITITLKERPVPQPVFAGEAMTENSEAPRSPLVILTVSDNGIGFPDHIDFRNTESVGLSLLVKLVEQINGSMELIRENGTIFIITFSRD